MTHWGNVLAAAAADVTRAEGIMNESLDVSGAAAETALCAANLRLRSVVIQAKQDAGFPVRTIGVLPWIARRAGEIEAKRRGIPQAK